MGTMLHIMDCRPYKNALANKTFNGAGFEDLGEYPNCSINFMDIENIHVMRKSRKRLGEVIHNHRRTANDADIGWLSGLDSTSWMTHLRTILKGTNDIIRIVKHEQCSVLVHCSDGWDRTSQICALVEMCLDSYYRTIEGFFVLIEKDWLAFGHQFHIRAGFRSPDNENSNRSPIFDQFMDATFQLLQQNPTAFEFTSTFLCNIMEQFYSCRFGNFLFNTNKDRMLNCIEENTLSMWDYMRKWARNRDQFLNPYYRRTKSILYPRWSLKVLKF